MEETESKGERERERERGRGRGGERERQRDIGGGSRNLKVFRGPIIFKDQKSYIGHCLKALKGAVFKKTCFVGVVMTITVQE